MRDIYLRAKGRTVIWRGDMLDLIYHNKCNIWISDFINLLIWVRKLVPYRKAVLQASPILRSIC